MLSSLCQSNLRAGPRFDVFRGIWYSFLCRVERLALCERRKFPGENLTPTNGGRQLQGTDQQVRWCRSKTRLPLGACVFCLFLKLSQGSFAGLDRAVPVE